MRCFSNCDPLVLKSSEMLDKNDGDSWRFYLVGLDPLEFLLWPSFHYYGLNLADPIFVTVLPMQTSSSYFFSLISEHINDTIVGGKPFCQLLKAMFSLMGNIYIEEKTTLITTQNAVGFHVEVLLGLDISIHFGSKSEVFPYFFHCFLLPHQIETLRKRMIMSLISLWIRWAQFIR